MPEGISLTAGQWFLFCWDINTPHEGSIDSHYSSLPSLFWTCWLHIIKEKKPIKNMLILVPQTLLGFICLSIWILRGLKCSRRFKSSYKSQGCSWKPVCHDSYKGQLRQQQSINSLLRMYAWLSNWLCFSLSSWAFQEEILEKTAKVSSKLQLIIRMCFITVWKDWAEEKILRYYSSLTEPVWKKRAVPSVLQGHPL